MASPTNIPLDIDAPVHSAGRRGLVGSAVWRHLEQLDHTRPLGALSRQLDLSDRSAAFAGHQKHLPRYVPLAAAKVGQIMANSSSRAALASDNIGIQVNLLDAAHDPDAEPPLFACSSCINPKFAEQPIVEESLLVGKRESTTVGGLVSWTSATNRMAAQTSHLWREISRATTSFR